MRVVFVGRHRTIWKRLVLYVLTFGVSRRVWLYRITKEMDGHDALGLNHRRNVVLLCLPILGPTWVAAQASRLAAQMTAPSPTKFGPWPAVYFPSWVPILGNLWYITWVQDRLNRFWAHERRHPEHGIDIDIGLDRDPAFLAEMEKALKASAYAGSRFDRRKEERAEVRGERAAVRAAGGSTPVAWWKRPTPPASLLLNITCSRCQAAFKAIQDPFADTPIVCWSCGLTEILPSLHANPLAPPEKAVVPTVRATCPKCETKFHALRTLGGPTELTCPKCGRKETLPGPTQKIRARTTKRPAKPKRR